MTFFLRTKGRFSATYNSVQNIQNNSVVSVSVSLEVTSKQFEFNPETLKKKKKVSVGNNPEDLELQASVDRLLERTSLHIVDIVKEGHLRKA